MKIEIMQNLQPHREVFTWLKHVITLKNSKTEFFCYSQCFRIPQPHINRISEYKKSFSVAVNFVFCFYFFSLRKVLVAFFQIDCFQTVGVADLLLFGLSRHKQTA